MKTKRFFSVLATLVGVAVFALTSCSKEEPTDKTLTLSKTTVSVQVGESAQLSAIITPAVDGAVVVFTSSNPAVASVTGNLQSATITGVAAGSATITASYDGKTATCAVTVKSNDDPGTGGDYDDFPQLQGSKYFVYFLDAEATAYLGNKVLYNFGPNDFEAQGSRWLYLWNGFEAGSQTGTDPFDLGNGWTSLKQSAGAGWAGGGLCVAINDDNNVSGENVPEDQAAVRSMASEISDFSQWYFAYAIKNATAGAGYILAIAPNAPDGDNMRITVKPAATGEWIYGEVCLDDVPGLEFPATVGNGVNVLTMVADPYMPGVQLDLGYAFIYKK